MGSPLSQILKDKGIRPSWQRLKILEFLVSDRTHPSAEEVYAALRQSVPALSKATVYNTLNIFADKGVVRTLCSSGAERHYDGISGRHGHIVCPKCGRIEDFEYSESDILALDNLMERSSAESVDFVINRICINCKHN